MSKSQNSNLHAAKSAKNDELTQERVRELFDYDAENGWLIRKKDEHGRVVNRPCGHKPTHSKRYGQVNINGTIYLTHRLVWLLVNGYMPEFIDHKNRDRMDNRIENLRPATRTENNQNCNINKNNTSGYTGVHFYKPYNKFVAYITVNCKHKTIGYFNTAGEASDAYKRAKIKFHPTSSIVEQYKKELGIIV